MKILTVFTQPIENNTSSMIRCRNVLNGIAAIGNEIVAYSPFPDKNSIYFGKGFNIHPSIEVRRYGKEIRNTLPTSNSENMIKTVLLNIYRKFDLFGSAVIYVKYTDEIVTQIRNEEYEMIFSFSGPIVSHIIANKIVSFKENMRYIQQWGDPLTADVTRKTFIPKWIQKIIESRLIRKADKICYVSPFTLKEQKILYPKYKNKMEFVPTPGEERNFKPTNNNKLTIGYFGSYKTIARNIIPLYEAVKVCNDVNLLIVGDSDIKLEGNGNIHIVNRTTPSEIDRLMSITDVIVCLMNSEGYQIPGKTYNYACTNKELLMITDGEQADAIQDFFQQYKRFSFVKNTKEEILKQIQKYIKEGVPERKAINEFTPNIIAEKMISL